MQPMIDQSNRAASGAGAYSPDMAYGMAPPGPPGKRSALLYLFLFFVLVFVWYLLLILRLSWNFIKGMTSKVELGRIIGYLDLYVKSTFTRQNLALCM